MKTTAFVCPACNKTAYRESRFLRRAIKRNKRGVVFCSLKCSQSHRAAVVREPALPQVCKKWSVEEEQIIRRDYPGGGAHGCNLPGRSIWAIQCRASLMRVRQFNNRKWQIERAKLNQPLVGPSRIAKQFREWAQMTARQCRAGLLIRLEIVDELPRLFAQKRNCPPPLSTPHTIGVYRSPTVDQVLSDLQHWDERRTINALRAAA